jgi:DNA replication initiation complex subunit (GINS family)
VDEVDMQVSMLEGDPELDIKVKEAIKAVPLYDNIFKRWESASKMRQWITEKKKNLIERIKKDVEAEYKKKKEEDKTKADEEATKKAAETPAAETPASEPPKEAAVVEEEKKESEEVPPVKLDDIVMIDTSSKPAEAEKVEEVVPAKEAEPEKTDG